MGETNCGYGGGHHQPGGHGPGCTQHQDLDADVHHHQDSHPHGHLHHHAHLHLVPNTDGHAHGHCHLYLDPHMVPHVDTHINIQPHLQLDAYGHTHHNMDHDRHGGCQQHGHAVMDRDHDMDAHGVTIPHLDLDGYRHSQLDPHSHGQSHGHIYGESDAHAHADPKSNGHGDGYANPNGHTNTGGWPALVAHAGVRRMIRALAPAGILCVLLTSMGMASPTLTPTPVPLITKAYLITSWSGDGLTQATAKVPNVSADLALATLPKGWGWSVDQAKSVIYVTAPASVHAILAAKFIQPTATATPTVKP